VSARRVAIYTAAFFAVTSLTITATRFGGGLALVWPGTGVAAALLLSLPRSQWCKALAALAAASTLATSLFGFGAAVAAPLAVVNVFEAWLVARLLLFARPGRDWFDEVGALASFVVVGGILAPALAALPGGLVASLVAPGPWTHHGFNWLAAHGLGTLMVLPLAYLASDRMKEGEVPARCGLAELAGHFLLVATVALLSLVRKDMPLLFLPILPVLLAAFRGGRQGATLGSLIVAGITLWAFYRHTSPIDAFPLSVAGKVLFLQFYLAIIVLLAIPVSVAMRQHQLVLAELEERKALKQLIAEHSDDALLNLGEAGNIRFASPAAERLTGMDDLEGHPLTVFFDPLDAELVGAMLARAGETPGQTATFERAVMREEGELWLEAKVRAVARVGKAAGLQGFAVTIRDVTARKELELDAIEAAETDTLTGLPNRRALLRTLESALTQSERRPQALAIIDLDHFKGINDTHGHLSGDDALTAVAGVMRRLSGPGRFFARLGGEEFALVANGRDFAAAQTLCELLRREIAALRFTSAAGIPFHITASVGLAQLGAGDTLAQALQAADILLYRAKRDGRNRVMTPASSAALALRAA
jgi:diguanylate cyclase (GGDEF)-like protein/PAS domain S-box-containing protein